MSTLVFKLGQLLATPPISIELLPGDGSEWLAEWTPGESNSHAPILFIEGNLGLPRKLAYNAYLESISTFRRCREAFRAHLTFANGLAQDILGATDVADLLPSSSVLLLVNPAHQSALNARKQLVRYGALEAALELRFVSALLTLHEGAKQSSLWHHRRWLLRRIYSVAGPSSTDSAHSSSISSGNLPEDREDSLCGILLDSDAFNTEFAAVSGACEVYPRNYHAWAHRYLCAEALVAALRGDAGAGLMGVWQEEEDRIREWIERHVSDYSAMQYACRLELLQRGLVSSGCPIITVSGGGTEESLPEEKETMDEHAWSLVQVYPSHESLWLYLRDALRPPFNTPEVRLESNTSDHVRDGARAFAERLLSDGSVGQSASVLPGEHVVVKSHAVRFLTWLLWKEGTLKIHGGVAREIMAAGRPSQGADLLILQADSVT